MEVHDLASLQYQIQYDSGVSGISGLSDHRSDRRMTQSTSDISRMSSSSTRTTDVTIMHTEEDTEMAKKFKKKVQKACSNKKARIETWDERCTGGVSAMRVRDKLVNTPAVLFFLVTNNFLDGYHATPYNRTVDRCDV